jgi:hypothetical protein
VQSEYCTSTCTTAQGIALAQTRDGVWQIEDGRSVAAPQPHSEQATIRDCYDTQRIDKPGGLSSAP